MPRSLDIIVPVYRNAELTRACVDSILRHQGEIAERRPRLLLINDSPDDDEVVLLLRALAAGRDDVSVLTNETNLGFVQTVNRGLALARQAGHDVLLVNSDTLTFPGTLTELLRATEDDEQIGFASPRSNNASLCSLPHFHGGAPATPEEAHRRWSILSATMPPWHFVPTTVGFYMFIDHRVLANHRGLRSHFGVGYEEENDLVMRAGKTGMRAIMVNRAFAFHAGSASFSLTDIDLDAHRQANHLKMVADHPEFLPLVRRYEASAHYRAERLMAGLLPDAKRRLRVCFDLTSLGQHHNGTNEHTTSVLRSLVARWSDRIAFTGIGSERSFCFHGLDRLDDFARAEPGAAGVHGAAVRPSSPERAGQPGANQYLRHAGYHRRGQWPAGPGRRIHRTVGLRGRACQRLSLQQPVHGPGIRAAPQGGGRQAELGHAVVDKGRGVPCRPRQDGGTRAHPGPGQPLPAQGVR
jgi:GT2 family glycosyltransferase